MAIPPFRNDFGGQVVYCNRMSLVACCCHTSHDTIMAHQLLLSASKQNNTKASRKKRSAGTNVNQKLLTEFQALIAFACYDSPLIIHGGSMRESTMETIMEKHCFGDPPGPVFIWAQQDEGFVRGRSHS
jgi:hypothetical protein